MLIIDNKMKHDEAVLVFGKKGISRSVTIVVAFLMKKFNYTLEVSFTDKIEFID